MMDGDTVFEPSTVRELVQPFGDPKVGAVAGCNAKVGNKDSLIGAWQHIEYVMGLQPGPPDVRHPRLHADHPRRGGRLPALGAGTRSAV